MSRCPRCGSEQKRSTPQHRRYFAIIRAAYHHWPEKHKFRPTDSSHLRMWLQCRAGHFTVHHVEIAEGATAAAVAGAVRAVMELSGGYAFVQADGEHALNVVIPKSINFQRLSHDDACKLFQEVEGVIWDEMGVEAEQLLKETERAA